jgi:predicted DNA-binding transcriptional regulator AlpA
MDVPATGLLRLRQILGDPKAEPPIAPLIPVSKSTWWQGIRDGRFPKPVRHLGLRITCWYARDIYALIEAGTKRAA